MQLVIDALGISSGGGRTILLDLLTELESEAPHWSVTVLTSVPDLIPPTAPGRPVSVWRLPLGRNRPWRIVWGQLLARWSVAIRQADVVLSLTCGLDSGRTPSIAYVQNALPFVRIPSQSDFKTSLRRWTLRRLMLRVIRNADRVIVQTEWFARTLRSLIPPHPAVAVVRPIPACSLGHVSPVRSFDTEPADGPVVLFVGSDLPHKNLNVLEKAWSRLFASEGVPKPAQLWIAGVVGPQDPWPKGVRYLGPVPRSEMCRYYETADVLVHPSVLETFGLAIVEARAHDVPVIAADRPYAREALGDTGCLFDPYSVDQLVECLGMFLNVKDPPSKGQQGLVAADDSGGFSLLFHIAEVSGS